MDPTRLRLGVVGFSPSDDGKTFEYHIDVGYGGLSWNLRRRFSEFHQLHNELFSQGYAALPKIPSRALTRPNDPEIAASRMQKLHRYVLELAVRPDLRRSLPLTQFLEFEVQTCVPMPPTKLETRAHTPDFHRFAVTDMYYDHLSTLLVVSQANLTPLARLGKAWMMIEPEEVGACSVYCLGGYVTRTGKVLNLERLVSKGMTRRVTSCFIAPNSQELFFGDAEGTVSCCKLAQDEASSFVSGCSPVLFPRRSIDMHIKAPVKSITGGDNVILTVGGDNVVRLVTADDFGVVSGGRVSKPLDRKESLTAALVFLSSVGRVVLGTTQAKLLVYFMGAHPSTFVGSINLVPIIYHLERKSTPSETKRAVPPDRSSSNLTTPPNLNLPVSAIVCSDRHDLLVVGVGALVLLFSLGLFLRDETDSEAIWGLSDEIIPCRGFIDCPLNPSIDISAMVLWEERSFLFTAYGRVIACWNLETSQLVQCIEEFSWGRINKLEIWRIMNKDGSFAAGLIESCFSVLAVATSSKGLQIMLLPSSAEKWDTWASGLEILESLKAATIKRDQLASSLWTEDRANRIGVDDCEEEVDDNEDSLVEAFGPARF